MTYRTKTYIAADWTGDKEAVEKLYEWKNNNRLNLTFVDAHDLTQARDGSLNCSIKKSLRERLNVSKKFVLIVGHKTKALTNGSCKYCDEYISYSNTYGGYCKNGYSIDYRSYIEYECEMAIKDDMDIVVIYNYTNIDKNKCPDCLKDKGKHIVMYYYSKDGKCYYNYQEIKENIND